MTQSVSTLSGVPGGATARCPYTRVRSMRWSETYAERTARFTEPTCWSWFTTNAISRMWTFLAPGSKIGSTRVWRTFSTRTSDTVKESA